MIDTKKYKNQKVKLTSTDDEYIMSVFELSRWCALIDAVEVVDKKMKQLGSRAPADKTWVKPIAIQKYVDEKYAEILFDITSEPENIKVLEQCAV